MLILIEMLKVGFPAGNMIPVPASHKEFLKNTNQNPSVTLLARVLSLFPLSETESEIVKVDTKNYELAVFHSYS